jgi:hypothetical protein
MTVRVERIEGGEPPTTCGLERSTESDMRTPQGRKASAMRATRAASPVVEGAQVGVDVVDGASVDADGGEQATVLADAGEVGADVAVVEEDGTAGVAALDGAVEVVPLVDPADGGGGRLAVNEGQDQQYNCIA